MATSRSTSTATAVVAGSKAPDGPSTIVSESRLRPPVKETKATSLLQIRTA